MHASICFGADVALQVNFASLKFPGTVSLGYVSVFGALVICFPSHAYRKLTDRWRLLVENENLESFNGLDEVVELTFTMSVINNPRLSSMGGLSGLQLTYGSLVLEALPLVRPHLVQCVHFVAHMGAVDYDIRLCGHRSWNVVYECSHCELLDHVEY
jgi:hypothetical protein